VNETIALLNFEPSILWRESSTERFYTEKCFRLISISRTGEAIAYAGVRFIDVDVRSIDLHWLAAEDVEQRSIPKLHHMMAVQTPHMNTIPIKVVIDCASLNEQLKEMNISTREDQDPA
jgi:hypothetical protein